MKVLPINALELIDSIDSKQHLMLAYDDLSYANLLKNRFIKNGLLNGEKCIVITQDKIKITEDEMHNHGINVDEYKKSGLLHIYQTPDPIQHPKSIDDGYTEIIATILKNSKPPYRIVGRISRNIRSEIGISICSRFEDIFHRSKFEKFGGSVFCIYDLKEIQANDRWQYWLSRLQRTHDVTIIQNREGKESIIFNNGHKMDA